MKKLKYIIIFVIINIILIITPFVVLSGNGTFSNNTNDEVGEIISSFTGFSSPVNEPYTITQNFGEVNDAQSVYRTHAGVDVVPSDSIIKSSTNGTVIATNESCEPFGGYLENMCGGGFGNYIVVETKIDGSNYKVTYGHLSKVYVKEKETVSSGEKIGLMGHSGNSSNPHLHFQVEIETEYGYKAINPIPLLELSTIDDKKVKLMKTVGIEESDYQYVDYIVSHESSWNYKAVNPSSGAYGLCQALPGTKMGTIASDWQTNPVTQLTWCDNYAEERYGSWQSAYEFWIKNNWW